MGLGKFCHFDPNCKACLTWVPTPIDRDRLGRVGDGDRIPLLDTRDSHEPMTLERIHFMLTSYAPVISAEKVAGDGSTRARSELELLV